MLAINQSQTRKAILLHVLTEDHRTHVIIRSVEYRGNKCKELDRVLRVALSKGLDIRITAFCRTYETETYTHARVRRTVTIRVFARTYVVRSSKDKHTMQPSSPLVIIEGYAPIRLTLGATHDRNVFVSIDSLRYV